MNDLTRRCNRRNNRAIVKDLNREVIMPMLYVAIALYIVFSACTN